MSAKNCRITVGQEMIGAECLEVGCAWATKEPRGNLRRQKRALVFEIAEHRHRAHVNSTDEVNPEWTLDENVSV